MKTVKTRAAGRPVPTEADKARKLARREKLAAMTPEDREKLKAKRQAARAASGGKEKPKDQKAARREKLAALTPEAREERKARASARAAKRASAPAKAGAKD